MGSHPRVRRRRCGGCQGLVELSRDGLRFLGRHGRIRVGHRRLGRAADRRRGVHAVGARHQGLVQRLRRDHRGQGCGRAARGGGRRVLYQACELLAVHTADRDREGRRRNWNRSVGVLIADRRWRQPLRLVRRVGRRVDRILRFHRVRRGGHHRRGDQEPAARRRPRHPRLAGHRHGALCRGVCRAVRHGQLHRVAR